MIKINKTQTTILEIHKNQWQDFLWVINYWMAWCKTDANYFFGGIFFHSKVPEFLHVLFNLSLVVKHSPVRRRATKAKNNYLLLRLVAFIVHISIFCPCFFKNKVQTCSQKNTGEYFITTLKSTCKNSGTFSPLMPVQPIATLVKNHSIFLCFS